MNTDIVRDAVRLCINILKSIPPTYIWYICNIAQSEKDFFSLPKIPEIPTSFGYTFDRVINFLDEEGVVEACVSDYWYQEMAVYRAPDDNVQTLSEKVNYRSDRINQIGQLYGYFTSYKDNAYCIMAAKFYQKNINTPNPDYGPKMKGQYAILINKRNLIKFINKYGKDNLETLPQFNADTGELKFAGEEIIIEGRINIKTMDLLIKNINSIVDWRQLFEVRTDREYDRSIEIDHGNKTSTNEIVKKACGILSSKIKENAKLSSILLIFQHKGFGMFIDQIALRNARPPQRTPQKGT